MPHNSFEVVRALKLKLAHKADCVLRTAYCVLRTAYCVPRKENKENNIFVCWCCVGSDRVAGVDVGLRASVPSI